MTAGTSTARRCRPWQAWSIVWVWSTLLTLRQHARRLRNIAAAVEEFQQLRQRLASAKTRLRGAPEIDL